jgi:hypothetical protein
MHVVLAGAHKWRDIQYIYEQYVGTLYTVLYYSTIQCIYFNKGIHLQMHSSVQKTSLSDGSS